MAEARYWIEATIDSSSLGSDGAEVVERELLVAQSRIRAQLGEAAICLRNNKPPIGAAAVQPTGAPPLTGGGGSSTSGEGA